MSCKQQEMKQMAICLDYRARPAGGNTLFLFMGDFGKASAWKAALRLTALAPQLRQMQATVTLVGSIAEEDEPRLGAAAHLAEQLELPFPLVVDCRGSLWQRYGAGMLATDENTPVLVVVDRAGRPVRAWSLRKQFDPRAVLRSLGPAPLPRPLAGVGPQFLQG